MARYALPVVALIIAPLAFSQESTLEEVVITSSFTHQVQGQNESSVAVIPGTDITENFTQSLGEHLTTIAGVSSNNFGPAVGQPVIRGLSSNRVKVLQNNLVVRDVAGIGPDHPVDLDLGNIEQVEIVRGAAALLHSNGASGGIINVVDNTIAKSDIEEPLFTLSAEQQTGNGGEGFSTAFKRNIGGFNVSYSFTGFDAQDYEVPNGAVLHEGEEHDDHDEDHAHEDAHDEQAHDDHDDHDDHEHDDHADEHDDPAPTHSEFHAEYALECAAPSELTQITFAYFEAFPNALELALQLLSDQGAQAFEIDRQAPVLDLAGRL